MVNTTVLILVSLLSNKEHFPLIVLLLQPSELLGLSLASRYMFFPFWCLWILPNLLIKMHPTFIYSVDDYILAPTKRKKLHVLWLKGQFENWNEKVIRHDLVVFSMNGFQTGLTHSKPKLLYHCDALCFSVWAWSDQIVGCY